jgi:hypothetical protein
LNTWVEKGSARSNICDKVTPLAIELLLPL